MFDLPVRRVWPIPPLAYLNINIYFRRRIISCNCANRRVGVDKIASRLLPPLGIRNKIVHVAVDDLRRLTAGPVINLGRRPRAAASLVARHFGSFALRGIWVDVLYQDLHQPAIVWSQKKIFDVGGRVHTYLLRSMQYPFSYPRIINITHRWVGAVVRRDSVQ